jgi:Domain of unknown function (DUF4136)
MAFWSVSKVKRVSLVLAAACLSALVAAGCDDRVQVTRDPDVRIARGATWAWQPISEPVAARDSRRVTSRDTMGRNEPVARDVTGDNQLVRDRVKTAIQQSLMAKGLSQVSDPATADFLVDYHFAVERRSATVQTVYPGAYPGLVCGPYRCWEGWGYGPSAVGYERVHFREGTIVFDFTQQSTKHLVYRATGQKPVRRDTFSLTQDEINGLVNHLLRDLKARK